MAHSPSSNSAHSFHSHESPDSEAVQNSSASLSADSPPVDPADPVHSVSEPTVDLVAGLDEAIASFDHIQSDLGYQQAQETLRHLLHKLDLTPQERQGLETDLAQLETMLDRLDQSVVQIAVFGMVGRGKSSILNALLGRSVFETGPLHGVTQGVERAEWTVSQEAIAGSDAELLRVSLKGMGNSAIELIDTPGIDEVQGQQRERLAQQVARQADLILFVVSGDITQVEYRALTALRQFSKPMLLVFNKVDQYPAADRTAIYEKIRDERLRELLSPDEIVMAAAAPLTTEAVRQSDGSITIQHRRGEPHVTDLKLRILDLLAQEGKALVALNTLLYADEVNEQIVQRKLEIRDRAANQVIWNSVVTKSVAIAVNPLVVVDLLSGAVIDVALLLALSRLYGIALTQTGAIGLLKHIALSMGGITASELVATLGLSSLKGLLGVSVPATGGLALAPYLSVAVTQAGVAGVSTYGIGQIAKAYLANGASWGAKGPKAAVSEILASLDETTILNRVKYELQERLHGRSPTAKPEDGDRPTS
ncbi:MAG: GTP-binding protein [Elainellaceae cyanobacterium]